MRICVFGLGYVGSVSAACFAASGHDVVGVDTNPTKVDLINAGRAPVIESGLEERIAAAVGEGRLRASVESEAAVRDSDLTLVCVGTPSQSNGRLDLQYVERACLEIGAALAGSSSRHVVVIRSTILPGTMKTVVIPALERASGGTSGLDFGVCNNPEFLREGSAIQDFFSPPKTVIGSSDADSALIVASLYSDISAPLILTEIEVAEMVKYADNAWHALKVAFANEIGSIGKRLGIDSHKVMSIFCEDTKLNLSPYYLKPGFAFGGSCLPKDIRALTYAARQLDVDVPLLSAVLDSNRKHIARGLELIMSQGRRRVGVLGFSFKAGTDDLRESPLVEVIETLLGKGFDIKVYDRNVRLSGLVGANREYINKKIPHISRLMVDSIEEVVGHSDVVVIGNNSEEFGDVWKQLNESQVLVDLVRSIDGNGSDPRYVGICW